MATGDSGKRNRPRDRAADGVAQRVADSVSGAVDDVADTIARKVSQTSDQLASKVSSRNRRLAAKLTERTEQLAEKIDEKRGQAVSKIDEQAGKATSKLVEKRDKLTAKAERLIPGIDASYEFWTRDRPGHRRPRFTHEAIAEAALKVVVAEGIDALSMRRLAAELDAGTMTLYHYVRTKDELYALLADRVMAELVLDDDEFPGAWRDAVTAIARRTREVMRRYPWMFDIAAQPGVGPNGLRHFDQSLQALSSLDLDFQQRLDIMTAVDEYVFGHCLHARSEAEVSDDDWESMSGYLVDLAAGGDYPQFAALVDQHGPERLWRLMRDYERDDAARFERNLTRLLNGIERDLLGER